MRLLSVFRDEKLSSCFSSIPSSFFTLLSLARARSCSHSRSLSIEGITKARILPTNCPRSQAGKRRHRDCNPNYLASETIFFLSPSGWSSFFFPVDGIFSEADSILPQNHQSKTTGRKRKHE